LRRFSSARRIEVIKSRKAAAGPSTSLRFAQDDRLLVTPVS
jgi:hypothetical protein